MTFTPENAAFCDKCPHTKHTGVCYTSGGFDSSCACPGSTFYNEAATVTSITNRFVKPQSDCHGFPGSMVFDGARHEDDLPTLPENFPPQSPGCGTKPYTPPEGVTAGFVSDGGSLPDWTDDRIYRLADVAEYFVEVYRAKEPGWPTEAREQLAIIYDLVNEDGR
jgi:hypothetical protein